MNSEPQKAEIALGTMTSRPAGPSEQEGEELCNRRRRSNISDDIRAKDAPRAIEYLRIRALSHLTLLYRNITTPRCQATLYNSDITCSCGYSACAPNEHLWLSCALQLEMQSTRELEKGVVRAATSPNTSLCPSVLELLLTRTWYRLVSRAPGRPQNARGYVV